MCYSVQSGTVFQCGGKISRMRVRACVLPSSPFLPSLFFYVPQIKSNSQPAMSSSSQGIRLCRLSFQQPVASSPPRAAPPDGCVSAGDPVIPAARCRALERSPRQTGNPRPGTEETWAQYVHAALESFAECLGLKIPLSF